MKLTYNKHVGRISVIVMSCLFLLNACNSDPGIQGKKEQLKEYYNELDELKFKIRELEKEIQKEGQESSDVPGEDQTLVKTTPVEKRPFRHFVEVRGSASSKKNLLLSAETSGIVKRILVSEGEKVSEGDLLVKIDDELIRRNIDEITTQLDLAREIYTRQKSLWEQQIGSHVQYLQAKNNKESLERRLASVRSQFDRTEIHSPIDGVVDELFINVGELANPGMRMARIINLEEMRMVAEVSEAYLGKINPGDTVTLRIPSFDIRMKLPVSHVGQFVNPGSRTFKIEIKLDNKNDRIKPNVLGVIRFADYTNPDALVIPSKIIQQSKGQDYVYIVKEEDGKKIARKQNIIKGRSYKGYSEVVEGLNGDESLIISGFRQVNEGEEVVIAKPANA